MFFPSVNKAVLGMSILRFFSGVLELFGALFMLKFGTVEKAFKINAIIVFISPFILTAVTAIGLVKLSEEVSFFRLFIICGGVVLIFLGLWKI